MSSDTGAGGDNPSGGIGLRLDKWLFHARFIKHRQLAGDLVRKRRIRLNSQIVTKSHQLVRVGDVATLIHGNAILVVRVRALGTRRGPASEAQALYDVIDRA
ncbi:MAG: RNA-binding S4 domain-containing protein [Geminicoccaceae bacterium]|nr:RNA-binding S4 domain-containing protein [Geminicoccaceae bacterium]